MEQDLWLHFATRGDKFGHLEVPVQRRPVGPDVDFYQFLAALGPRLAAQGQHWLAYGIAFGGQGLHMAALGQHFASQGLHLAA